MSEILTVAKALSQSSDDDLVRVVGIRLLSTANFADFFDLATALIKPQSINGAIAGLTRLQITAFRNLLERKSAAKDKPQLEVLATLFLVQKKITDGKTHYIPLESAVEAFKTIAGKVSLNNSVLLDQEAVDLKLVDAQSGIAAFETVQALTELLIDLEQRYVREVGRASVGLPELKRLALHLGREVDYAKSLYSLGQMAGLITLSDKRWRVGSEYLNWLQQEPAQRWLLLAKTWRMLLGEQSSAEFVNVKALDKAMKEIFPLANDGIASHMTRLVSLAELIGLSSGSKTSSWFTPLMQADLKTAAKLLASALPKTQSKVIVQADLSIISVGPLPTKTELELRRFVETERIGVASTYRINTLSLTYGLETGLTEADIRNLLAELSGTALPQPVDYLIREAASRFGRLVLTEGRTGTLISSSDQILLTHILNDTTLRPISIARVDEATLQTRFELDIVYYQLRESKYAAIRKDAQGRVISNWSAAGGLKQTLNTASSVLSDIKRWRDHDLRLGESPEGSDIVRQLELAIKSKGSIQVAVLIKKVPREFLLEPTGLANGRLRGKDRKADCERVIPLSSITGVRLG
ncbi:MAG: helicase-associated domain-containing protein [Actinomycetes bacterium]